MKVATLREMTREELAQRRNDLKEEYFNLQMRRTLKPLDNPVRLREIRREIARIETITTEDSRGIRTLSETKVDILEKK